MRWHDEGRVKDGKLRHPADGIAWKSFDERYSEFASEPLNVRFALATDGFNPYRLMSTTYSTWPVVLIPYNLPPWLVLKPYSLVLSMIIPGKSGPGNDIDVYLQPLLRELKILWEGVDSFDAYSGEWFKLRASLMCTINDFPAYAMLSGWSTKGKFINYKKLKNPRVRGNDNIVNDWIINEFSEWLQSQVHSIDDSTAEGKVRKALASGLNSSANRFKGFMINGYKQSNLSAPNRENNTEQLDDNENVQGSSTKKSRYRSIKSRVVTAPQTMKIDEKEEVLTIDAQGKQMILSGLIRPRDIDLFEVGVRCAVQFNEFHQPLHKGGSVLVKYLGSLAKNKRFCPIEEKTWYSVNDQLKENIVQLVPSRFVIPDDWSYNNAILTRVCKKWRQYRHDLKKEKFNPLVRTKEQIYNDVPNGQERNSWMHLVDHWYSEESQSLSQLCKEARASQVHVHITGATSYANKRVDFVKSKGRKPSHLEFFKLTHSKVDGSFVDNTLTSDFLTEATAKVQELANSSNPFSELEIENQVFDSLMYDQGKPRKLVGFGLGVKESDVFGVGGLVKKTMSGDCMNSLVEMENLKSTISSMKEENEIALASINKKNEEALESIKKENEELRAKMDQTNQILRQALRAMRVGTVTHHFLDTAQAALQMDDSHVASSGGENL